MRKIAQILMNNGFEHKEAIVYLCVLEMGELPVSRIALKTNLKRSTTYTIVESLHRKGYVSVNIHKGMQYVSAISPQVLIDSFKRSAGMAEEILPELINIAYASPFKPRIRFFEGLEGIKQVLREFSHSKTRTMGFSDYRDMPENLLDFIRGEVIPQRKKNKNRAQFIVPNNEKNQKIQEEDAKYYTEHKLVNFPSPTNPIELLIFGESEIAFLSYTKGEQFGVIIDSASIHDTLQNIFLLIWSLK